MNATRRGTLARRALGVSAVPATGPSSRGCLRAAAMLPFLLLVACGGGGSGGEGVTHGSQPVTHLGPTPVPTPDPAPESEKQVSAQLRPAVTGAAYSDVLARCVTAAESGVGLCSLAELPLLGQEVSSPSVDDIMRRTVVSHDWMGQRLAEVLPLFPQDVLRLARSVTAFVISADIRGFYYSTSSGAIYLDPGHLWLSNEEKATIAKEGAPGSGNAAAHGHTYGHTYDKAFDNAFDNSYNNARATDLAFRLIERYVKDDESAWERYSLDGSRTRRLNDLVWPLGPPLYHELAHANDFFPQSMITSLDSEDTLLEAAYKLGSERVATRLNAAMPLTSQILRSLSRVIFSDESPTEGQMTLDGAFVGAEFSGDGANRVYGYMNIYEDVATLFEEVMMHHHFGIDLDTGLLRRPLAEAAACNDYIVEWGVRNRIAEPHVRARAEFVVGEMMNTDNPGSYFAGVGAEQKPLESGVGWCQSSIVVE